MSVRNTTTSIEHENGRFFVDHAELLWPNFSGTKTDFNAEGRKSFNIIVNEKDVEDLKQLGINVKKHVFTPKNGDEEEITYHMNVKIGDKYPPEIYTIAFGKKRQLSYENFGILDKKEYDNIDLEFKLRHYSSPVYGEGNTCYLQRMWFTCQNTRFDEKYSYLDDSDEEVPF